MVAASTDAEVRVAFSTAPDETVAAQIARVLVDERLAAGAHRVPGVRSIYRGQNVVGDEREVLLVITPRADRIAALAERLRALHPYDVPELLVLPTAGGLAPYLDWVRAETRP
jgi:periplasmic divalent cation tolerance protein